VKLSIVIITLNEEANIARTLKSIAPLMADGNTEIIIVDSGSTDRTCEIAREFGALVFHEHWQGFATQKNSAIEKARGEWILSLDADEEVSKELAAEIAFRLDFQGALRQILYNAGVANANADSLDRVELIVAFEEAFGTEIVADEEGGQIRLATGFYIPRRNLFLGRWIKHGGFYPDSKLRLFRRGAGSFEERIVHETAKVSGPTGKLNGDLIHHAYPTLSSYIEHMNRYSSLGAELAIQKNQISRSIFAFVWNVFLRPRLTFFYNYILRLGFLDGREGLLLHLYHSAYVSWKYAKAWEKAHSPRRHGGTEK
jgi:glycosyltransferase involved in cell wall biosynthesis